MAELPYLTCHAFRHDWEEVSVLKAPQFGVACDYRCTNCTGIKREIFSRMSGVLISRYYVLPKDYRGPVGTTKADYRKDWLEQKVSKIPKKRSRPPKLKVVQ
jgi:hypothetical protein